MKNGLLETCKQLGITIIAYSPLGMGRLTGKYTKSNPPKGLRFINNFMYYWLYLENLEMFLLKY